MIQIAEEDSYRILEALKTSAIKCRMDGEYREWRNLCDLVAVIRKQQKQSS